MKKTIVILLTAVFSTSVFYPSPSIEASSYQSESSIIFKKAKHDETGDSNDIPDGIVEQASPPDQITDNQLPKTATVNYLLIFLGLIILVINVFIFLLANRKRSQKIKS